MSVDLRSRYLGLELKNPIVAAASPMTNSIDRLKRLENAGVAAVVLPSLFEEQIEHEEMAAHNLMLSGTELSPEAHGFFPEIRNYRTGPENYLRLIGEAKQAACDHHAIRAGQQQLQNVVWTMGPPGRGQARANAAA